MKKNLFIAAAALAVLASCSQESELTQDSVLSLEPTPVSFGTYQSGTTRTAIANTADLANAGGFGVFAYYTQNDNYELVKGGIAPNFMYNQDVTSSDRGTSWSYSPLKYWPNDFTNGNVDGNEAKGSGIGGKVSFFAYAPYVEVTNLSNGNTANSKGIVEFTGNEETEHPKVRFEIEDMKDLSKTTDLLWGTAGTSTISKAPSGTQEGTTVDDGEGHSGKAKVWANLTRPTTDAKIKFNFVHALSKFAGQDDADNWEGVKIKANPDEGDLADTKITVKSITIENGWSTGADDVDDTRPYTSGALDLVTGIWELSMESLDELSYTIDDGTGSNPQLADDILEPASVSSFDDLPAGVTKTAKKVYKDDQPSLVFIPGSQPSLKITVDYFVRTKDTNLASGYSQVEQKITKTIQLPELLLNKAYSLVISLGLTSVKFEAEVKAWETQYENDGDGDPYILCEEVVDLPAND